MVRVLPRHRILRRCATAAVALVLGASGLAACSGSNGSSHNTATSGHVTWWGWTPEPEVASSHYIKEFNKQYPNIDVTYKKFTLAGYDSSLRPALEASVGPDIFDIAPGGGIGSIAMYAKYAVDMTPTLVRALGRNWRTKLAPTAVTAMVHNGRLAGLAAGSTFAGPLWINQDLFDRYHVSPPTNLEQWTRLCAIFKTHHVGCFVQGVGQSVFNQDTLQAISDNIQPGLWTKAAKHQAKWTDPVFIKALTIWKSLFHNGVMQPRALGAQQYPDAHAAFLAGRYAMIMMGTWYMQYTARSGMSAAMTGAQINPARPFTAVPIPFPDVAGNGRHSGLFGDPDFGLAVNRQSKVRAAATTFVRWLATSQAGQQAVANALNDIPARTGIVPDWASSDLVNYRRQRPLLEKLISAASTTTEPRLSVINAQVQDAIGEASISVASGRATPEQAAAVLQAAADAAK